MSIIVSMINKVIKKITEQKHAIIWSISYIILTWAVLYFLFNFNIFSIYQWDILIHAHLTGFAGFAFGIMLLSALPLYIATTTLIVRTKKPLFETPKFLQPKKEEKKEETPKEEAPKENPITEGLPQELPNELRHAFILARSRKMFNAVPVIKEDKPEEEKSEPAPVPEKTEVAPSTPAPEAKSIPAPAQQATPITQTDAEGDMPIPDDFDFFASQEDMSESFAPTFSDIKFDDDDEDEESAERAVAEQEAIKSIEDYLTKHSIAFEENDNIITTNKNTIAVHADSEFWIADPEIWFAAGKHKESPTEKILKISATNKTTPVLYLKSTNILDLETKTAEWESQGIKVIKDLSEL